MNYNDSLPSCWKIEYVYSFGQGAVRGAHHSFFTIDDSSEDPVYQGSRGAGICLKDGVEAVAKGENGSGEIIVRFKNGEYGSGMYRDVLSELVDEIPEIGVLIGSWTL